MATNPNKKGSTATTIHVVEIFDDDDFMQYFAAVEIPDEIKTIRTQINVMEAKIRFLNTEQYCKVH